MEIQDYSGTIHLERDTNHPKLSGTVKTEIGSIGSIAELWVGGTMFTVPVDPLTGKWTWTATAPLLDGEYSVEVRIIDAAKNVSTPILASIVIDTTPPEAPEVISMFDDVGVTGYFSSGEITDDKRPTLTGIAQKGTTIYLHDADGNTIGSAVADIVTGKWVMEPLQDLATGSNSLTLVAEETFAGKVRQSVASDAFIINVSASTLPPDTITINDAWDDAGSVTSSLASGALTDDTTPTLRGDVSSGNTVTVYWRVSGSTDWDGSATATVTDDKWEWTPGTALAEGAYEFQAAISGGTSVLFSLEIATDVNPRILYAEDNVGDVQDNLASGDATDDTTPTLHGRAEANAEISLRYSDGGGTLITATVKASDTGSWSWTPPALDNGEWTFETQNADGSWRSFELTIDKDLDVSPGIDYAIDNVGAVTDNLVYGDTTDDSTPELRGTGAANSVMDLRYSKAGGPEVSVKVTVAADGTWSWQAPTLENSTWTFEVKRNNQTDWASAFELTIDAVPPVVVPTVPVFVNIVDNQGTNNGNIAPSGTKGKVTDDTTPTLEGTGTANSIVYFQSAKDGGSWGDMGSAQVKADGTWSFTPAALDISQWQFRVMAKNSAGESDWSSKIWLNIAPDAVINEVGYETFYNIRNGLDLGASFTFKQEMVYKTKSGTPASIENFQLAIAENSVIILEFPTTKMTAMSFDYSGISSPMTHIDFLDANGTVIETRYFDTSATESQRFFFKSYDNKVFKSVMITSGDEAKANDSGWFLDNIAWGIDDPYPPMPQGVNQVNTTTSDLIYSADINEDSQEKPSIKLVGSEIKNIEMSEILESGQSDFFINDGKTQLMIEGEQGSITLNDILKGEDLGNWEHQTGTVTIAGEQYGVYQHSGADVEVLVQLGVQVEVQNH